MLIATGRPCGQNLAHSGHRPYTGFMIDGQRSGCCVCDSNDGRALVQVVLTSGRSVTLCGSHALMQQRSGCTAASEAELRAMLRDRRGRNERRGAVDELGAALTAAFSGERRGEQRRRSRGLP
jgi:hypothetical protein